MPDRQHIYHQRQVRFEAEARRYQARYDRLAYVRLIVFFALVALVVVAGNWQWWAGGLAFILALPLFAYGVSRHQRLAQRARHFEHLAGLAAGETLALEHDFEAFPAGTRYRDPDHPYAGDLDIFGPHSLYQFLNRTVTAGGADRLAEYLSAAAPTPVVLARQQSVAELGEALDWCHEFRARGTDLDDRPEYRQRLLAWLAEPEWVGRHPVLAAARWFVPLFFGLTMVGLFTLPVWQLALVGLLPVAWVMHRYYAEIGRLHEYTARAGEALRYYATLLEQIEGATFNAPLLHQLREPIARSTPNKQDENPGGASRAIRRLRYAISQLDVRHNAFSILLEVSTGWSIHWVARLESWKRRHREALPAWLENLAEIDSLVSLGNLRYNQPGFAVPTVGDQACYFASQLAHPLLPPTSRVANDLEIGTDGHIHLVTGSNMAGKSTWLRTVGVNVVLALAGAPVCATAMQIPQLRLWTSMRTQDALHESTSSFYAELKRLQAIISAVEHKTENVFFLLDEILKGTNSRDRHVGAKALIRQLIQAEGAGLIATHDLELAELADEPGSRVENYAMEVSIDGGELVFDYQLRPGVSQSFNATLLMAQMGIRINEEDISLTHD